MQQVAVVTVYISEIDKVDEKMVGPCGRCGQVPSVYPSVDGVNANNILVNVNLMGYYGDCCQAAPASLVGLSDSLL